MKRDGSTEAGVSMEHVRNGGTSALQVSVDPEVPARAKRRRFTAEYKLRVLEEAEASREPGEVAALLRREGLYSSHLAEWRRARRPRGSLKALAKPRGPQGRRRDRVAEENEQLRKENVRLRRRLQQAQAILEIQKKASEILGTPLNPPPCESDE